MSTSKEYKEFILEQLEVLDNITIKQMMGEYLLYYNGKLFGGIYDNRLLIKISDGNSKYKLKQEIPYKGAKPMLMIEDIEDKEKLKEIVIDTCNGLPNKK